MFHFLIAMLIGYGLNFLKLTKFSYTLVQSEPFQVGSETAAQNDLKQKICWDIKAGKKICTKGYYYYFRIIQKITVLIVSIISIIN